MRDLIEMFTDSWLGIIIGLFIVMGLAVSLFAIIYPLTHTCVAFHKETQYQLPPGVVVGGGKSSGGVSIPLGNMRPVNVTVCDKYK